MQAPSGVECWIQPICPDIARNLPLPVLGLRRSSRGALARDGALRSVLTDPQAHGAMSQAVNPYGDGKSSQRIVRLCEKILDEGLPGDG